MRIQELVLAAAFAGVGMLHGCSDQSASQNPKGKKGVRGSSSHSGSHSHGLSSRTRRGGGSGSSRSRRGPTMPEELLNYRGDKPKTCPSPGYANICGIQFRPGDPENRSEESEGLKISRTGPASWKIEPAINRNRGNTPSGYDRAENKTEGFVRNQNDKQDRDWTVGIEVLAFGDVEVQCDGGEIIIGWHQVVGNLTNTGKARGNVRDQKNDPADKDPNKQSWVGGISQGSFKHHNEKYRAKDDDFYHRDQDDVNSQDK